jgi:hypothetical protein
MNSFATENERHQPLPVLHTVCTALLQVGFGSWTLMISEWKVRAASQNTQKQLMRSWTFQKWKGVVSFKQILQGGCHCCQTKTLAFPFFPPFFQLFFLLPLPPPLPFPPSPFSPSHSLSLSLSLSLSSFPLPISARDHTQASGMLSTHSTTELQPPPIILWVMHRKNVLLLFGNTSILRIKQRTAVG